jgi:hypothetical protein
MEWVQPSKVGPTDDQTTFFFGGSVDKGPTQPQKLIIPPPPRMQNELSFCMQHDNGRGDEEKEGEGYLAWGALQVVGL